MTKAKGLIELGKLAAAIETLPPVPDFEFDRKRYPEHYANEMMRRHPELIPQQIKDDISRAGYLGRIYPGGWIATGRDMKPAEAAAIRSSWSWMLSLGGYELAVVLADGYLSLREKPFPMAKVDLAEVMEEVEAFSRHSARLREAEDYGDA